MNTRIESLTRDYNDALTIGQACFDAGNEREQLEWAHEAYQIQIKLDEAREQDRALAEIKHKLATARIIPECY